MASELTIAIRNIDRLPQGDQRARGDRPERKRIGL